MYSGYLYIAETVKVPRYQKAAPPAVQTRKKVLNKIVIVNRFIQTFLRRQLWIIYFAITIDN